MPYPKILRKINQWLGRIGGMLCFVVAIMFLVEALLRYVFKSPTSWLQDYACYLHCLALFMGCAFTFQVHGHVGVDMVRRAVDKKTKGARNRLGARIMSIVGHLQTLAFLGIGTYAIYNQMTKAYGFHSMTEATYPIPQWILYAIMFGGCVLMLITVICIILSLFTESDEFIE